MADDIGSTVPRRQLGRLLRQFRTEAGVTLDAAADALEYSRQMSTAASTAASTGRRAGRRRVAGTAAAR